MTTLRATVASVLLALPAVVVAVPIALPTDVADPHLNEGAVPDVAPSDGGGPDSRDATGGVVPGNADQITFGIAPAGPDGADGRVSFRLELEPGASHTDHVVVANYSEEPITLALLASDGTVTAGGNFDVLPSDVAPEAAGSWVEIENEVELEPMGSAVVPFTITVPDDATPGDQPAGIVASLRSVGTDEEGSSVSLDSRAGARLHLRVAGDLVPALGVGDVQAEYRPSWNPFAPGTVDLSWTVENEGNVRLGAAQVASIEGLLGLGGGDVVVDGPREVLPRQSATQTASIEAWPLLRHGVDLRVTPVVVGSDDVAGALTAATASVAVWTVPWAQLAVVVLLVLVVVMGVRRRRRQQAAIAAAIAAAREEAARSRDDDVVREPLPTRG